jgi:hypothetical protein
MNRYYDHNDLFHWLKVTKSYAINMFSCSFFNSNSQLVKTLIGCGSLLSPGLDGNKYFVDNNGCNLYTN